MEREGRGGPRSRAPFTLTNVNDVGKQGASLWARVPAEGCRFRSRLAGSSCPFTNATFAN